MTRTIKPAATVSRIISSDDDADTIRLYNAIDGIKAIENILESPPVIGDKDIRKASTISEFNAKLKALIAKVEEYNKNQA